MILWRALSCVVFLSFLVVTGTSPLFSQSMNIDFGEGDHQPPALYAGAGIPGYWNSIPAAHGTTTPAIQDLNGNPTAVSIRQFGGEDLLLEPGPSLAPAAGFLLNDYLVTYNPALESCLFINDMADGWYQILVYAWTPSQSSVLSYTNCDEEPGNPHYLIGGTWPGQQLEGITYALHYAQVSDDNPFPGQLRLHSGIVPGADASMGAALNGIQIRYLGSCRADVTSAQQNGPDGIVDMQDFGFVAERWGTEIPGADITGPNPLQGPGLDGQVDIRDVISVANSMGVCPESGSD